MDEKLTKNWFIQNDFSLNRQSVFLLGLELGINNNLNLFIFIKFKSITNNREDIWKIDFVEKFSLFMVSYFIVFW